jgi:hypothetical protein
MQNENSSPKLRLSQTRHAMFAPSPASGYTPQPHARRTKNRLAAALLGGLTVLLQISAIFTTLALIFGVLVPREEAVAQTAKDLIGTWALVSVTLEQDSKKVDMYGANPQGQAIFDPNGHFSITFIRSDVPKFASTNRQAGTPEENKAAVQGSIAYFGTYSISETDKVVTYHVEGSTFPNWRGTDQKRLFKLSADELTFSNPSPSTGSGNAGSVWRRAR